ncbi:AMP-binding protein [Nonomuraea sp. NPDC050404]|uniref:(2,3-dihydroxybenzoyl)adenylate synthase n=1 Tax=Nonomuraea sp. NPDC050404 TaxID=3155783 RepID=UPI0033FAF59B
MGSDLYRSRGWWQWERLDQLALAGAAAYPGKCALIDGERRMTHTELATAVDRAAAGLRRLGIARGDRVLLQLPNGLEFVVVLLALCRIGAPAVLATPALREHELDRIAAAVEPVAMVVPRRARRFDHLALARRLRATHESIRLLLLTGEGECRQGEYALEPALLTGPPLEAALAGPAQESGPLAGPAVAQASEPPAPSDVALLLHSSGTTGPPKLVPRTHEDYGCLIRTAREVAGVSADTVYLAVLPMAHTFTLSNPGVIGTLAAGGTVVATTPDDPRQALRDIERLGVTHSSIVPTLLGQWLAVMRDEPHDTGSLRVLQVGGAKVEPAIALEARKSLGCGLQQVYGMSEGLVCMTRLDDPEETAVSTQGRPISPGDEIRVVTGSGESADPGTPGELLARGPYTATGYFRDPEATARAFTGDSFYRTGDLVSVDRAGNVSVVGRLKNVINRGGEKICAEELEAMAAEHPAVAAAAAVAMPHPAYGEAVCLYLALLPGAGGVDLLELRRYLQQRGIARFKLPERVEVLDELPSIGIGKVDRRSLRAMASETS